MRSLAVLLSVTLVLPSTVLASEPVSIDVVTSNLGREGPMLERQLGDRVTLMLAAQGMSVESEATERRVRIRVHRNEVFGYEVEVGLVVHGEVVGSGVEPFVCDPCGVLALYDRVEETMPQVAAAIREHDGTSPVGPVVDEEPQAELWIGAVGMVGIVITGASIAAIGSGGSMLVRGEAQRRSPTEGHDLLHEHPRKQGWAWLGVGLVGLAAGATMVAVDLTVLHRQWERRLSVHPDFGRGMGGVVLQGRF